MVTSETLILLAGMFLGVAAIIAVLLWRRPSTDSLIETVTRLSKRVSTLEQERIEELEVRFNLMRIINALWRAASGWQEQLTGLGQVPREPLPRDVEQWLKQNQIKSGIPDDRKKVVTVKQLIEHDFNAEELNSLAFDLGIKKETIGGESHEARVINLVTYCERHDLLDRLILQCQELRPLVDWPA